MKKIPVMLHGFGNIGRMALRAVEASPDLECLGVVRGRARPGAADPDLRGAPDFRHFDELVASRGRPEVAILCAPTRLVPEIAERYLAAGLHTIDSFDIHAEIPALLEKLSARAVQAGRAAVVAAGWDPGTDSVLRALFEAMVPVGATFTNFGRGRSLGHSAAVRAADGVADAISLTLPLGGGRHARLACILPEPGASREAIEAQVRKDPYFTHDPLEIRFVDSAAELASAADHSHGVRMERTGASSSASNQQLTFDMRIDNPALTGQVLAAAARAAVGLKPGAYTLIDIPPVMLLPGDRMGHIARLV